MGPKGSGLLYINENVKIHPYIHGGSQERNMRAGTENVYGIVVLPRRWNWPQQAMRRTAPISKA